MKISGWAGASTNRAAARVLAALDADHHATAL